MKIIFPTTPMEVGVRAVDRRVHLRLRVLAELTGCDLSGRDFTEPSTTVLVSPSGAILESGRALAPDQEVSLRYGQREALARVLGQAGLTDSKYLYGISFIQADAAFWGVHFPLFTAEARVSTALIECGRCGTQRTYVLNEIEALVLATSRSFGLHCPACKDATLWKTSTSSHEQPPLHHSMLQEPAVEALESHPESQAGLVSLAASLENNVPQAPRKNQRKHARITMPRAKACVQCPNSREEFVELLDVSKGGASFRSGKVYALGSWIRIAAPCTVGAGNIFVPARVVRARKAEIGCEYGVEYVNSGS